MSDISAGLQEHREIIDRVDNSIAELLSMRFELTDSIGTLKREANISLSDSERETAIIERVSELAVGLEREEIAKIYATIFAVSKARMAKS
ncbi:hypothetical protein RsTz2092_09110 [Deferribacterales bacterium RsTz2092]|nr:hypothetical protein AGMMS49941_06980 [Deferribacterales bacterium]